MKTILRKIQTTANTVFAKAQYETREAVRASFIGERGEGFFDSASKIIIVIVLAVLALGAVLGIANDVIFPSVKQRIMEMFDTSKTPIG